MQVAALLAGGVESPLRSFQQLKLPVEIKKCAYLGSKEVEKQLSQGWSLPSTSRTDAAGDLWGKRYAKMVSSSARLISATPRARRLKILLGAGADIGMIRPAWATASAL